MDSVKSIIKKEPQLKLTKTAMQNYLVQLKESLHQKSQNNLAEQVQQHNTTASDDVSVAKK